LLPILPTSLPSFTPSFSLETLWSLNFNFCFDL
jgi:hypothetical protein